MGKFYTKGTILYSLYMLINGHSSELVNATWYSQEAIARRPGNKLMRMAPLIKPSLGGYPHSQNLRICIPPSLGWWLSRRCHCWLNLTPFPFGSRRSPYSANSPN